MKYVNMTFVTALAAVAAACGGSETPTTEQSAATSPTPAMADMMPAPSQNAQRGKGSGTVTAIDTEAGTITLDHGPIPELSWPAMKMAFKAAPPVLEKARSGDKVEFEVRLSGDGSEVTAMTKK